MAATVLFLAGPGGVFYNEQIVYPDGGMLIKIHEDHLYTYYMQARLLSHQLRTRSLSSTWLGLVSICSKRFINNQIYSKTSVCTWVYQCYCAKSTIPLSSQRRIVPIYTLP
jgi:hypothetical protein